MRRWCLWLIGAALLVIGTTAAHAVVVPPASMPGLPDPEAGAPPSAAPPDAAPPAVTAPQPPPPPSAADVAAAKVEAAIDNALTLQRKGQIGLATIFDGNKFAQCRRMAVGWILCEAAGVALQPSLAHVITIERAMRLFALGWTIDPRFGSYVRVFPGDTTSRTVARQMLRALSEGYDADLANLETRTAWVRDTKCPPRNGPRQNLAGSIDDSPAMAHTAIHGCLYLPAAATALAVDSVPALLGLYGLRVKGEVERLIVNNGAHGIHLILDGGGGGYVQCAPDTAPPSLYCEAASADSVPALGKVLTPDRLVVLHGLGFTDPGRGPNFSRVTPLQKADARLMTLDLLMILFDVYGYRGDPLLKVSTEKGG